MKNATKVDLAIIGGGILGVALAYHLANDKRRVLILEKESGVAHHASGKNAGMIRHAQHHEHLSEWVTRSVAEWPKALREQAFSQTGSKLITASGETQYSKADGLLDSGTFVSGLVTLAQRRGASVHLSADACQLSLDSNKSWVIHLNDQSVVIAERVVISSGAWSETFERDLSTHRGDDSTFGLHSLVRHLSVIGGFRSSLIAEHQAGFFWDEQQPFYYRDWGINERIVSSCDETPGFPTTFSPNNAFIDELADRLSKNHADNLTLRRSWFCFRTFTTDNLPLVGADPQLPNLYWFSGFGGFGMSTGFAAAADLAAELSSGIAAIPNNFKPLRFAPNFADSRPSTRQQQHSPVTPALEVA